jgi:hypothetical protein
MMVAYIALKEIEAGKLRKEDINGNTCCKYGHVG